MFSGTIHALVSKCFKSHCARLSLWGNFEVIREEKSLWTDFIINIGYMLGVIPEGIRNDFLCVHDIDKLLECARDYNLIEIPEDMNIISMLDIDLVNIFAYRHKNNETKTAHFIHLLREWDSFRQNGDYFPMPNCIDICSNQTLIQLWNSELKDFLRWKQNSEKFFVTKIAHLYKIFRISSGKLKYEDLINLSIDLLKNPSVISEIENLPYHAILDEAQDTDTQQFRFLLGIVQKVLHEGISIDISKKFRKWLFFDDGRSATIYLLWTSGY